MKQQALVIQGWYQKTDSNWYPWLEKELEKRAYKVFLPDLPTMHTDLPEMKEQLNFTEKLLTLDHETIVFGHSLGCLLAMRLGEKNSYKKMFLIAGWDYNDLSAEHRLFWKTPINHVLIKQHVKKIYCISSDNDPYVTAFMAKEMSKRLGATFILVKGAGHFTEKDGVTTMPEVLPFV